MILRLMRHDVDIVGANCISRRPPYALTARTEANEWVYTSNESSGLEKVGKVGTGVLLVSMEVFKNIEPPWFNLEWFPMGHHLHTQEGNQDVLLGEDYWFCDVAKKAGYEIYIDHDVSKEVLHIGQFGYSPTLKVPIAGGVSK